MQSTKKYIFAFEEPHIALIAKDNREIVLNHNIENLPECMDTIISACPNLQKVDFTGISEMAGWEKRYKEYVQCIQ